MSEEYLIEWGEQPPLLPEIAQKTVDFAQNTPGVKPMKIPTSQTPASEFSQGLVELAMNGQTVLCCPEKAELYLKAKLHQERHKTADFATAVRAVGG